MRFPKLELPEQDVTDEPRVSICFNQQWREVLMSALGRFEFDASWVEGTDFDRSNAQTIILQNMILNAGECEVNTCCTDITLYRVNLENGTLEISTDGGVTWIPDPTSPANMVYQLPPPVTSGVSATKCDAATNGFQHLKDIIDHDSETITAGGSVFAVGAAIAAFIIAVFISGGAALAFASLIFGAVSGAIAYGGSAFDAYWDSTNEDKILCAIYCFIAEDGSIDETAFNNIVSRLMISLPSSPAKDLFMSELKGMGWKGLGNLCAYGNAADSDCSSCECDEVCNEHWNILSGFGDFFGSYDPETDVNEGTGEITIHLTNINTDGKWYIDFHTDDKDTCCLAFSYTVNDIDEETPSTLNQAAYQLCGSEIDVGALISAPLTGNCVNHIQMRWLNGQQPESVTFKFKPCV